MLIEHASVMAWEKSPDPMVEGENQLMSVCAPLTSTRTPEHNCTYTKRVGGTGGGGKRIYNKIKQYSLLSHFSSNVLSLSHKFPESQLNLEFYIYLKAHTSSRVYFMSQFEFLAYIPHSQMFDISITGKQSQPLVQCYKAGLP